MPKNILLAIQAAAGALKSNEYSINTLEPIEAIMARENVADQDGHILTEELLNALNKNVDLMNSPGLKGINEFANWLERTGIAEDFYRLAIFIGVMSGMEKGHYEPEPKDVAEVAEGAGEVNPKDIKPPEWNEKWEWRYPEANKTNAKPRWFDPSGGEWRWHAPDKWHPEGHWDYNPWDVWNSEWQNIYPD